MRLMAIAARARPVRGTITTTVLITDPITAPVANVLYTKRAVPGGRRPFYQPANLVITG